MAYPRRPLLFSVLTLAFVLAGAAPPSARSVIDLPASLTDQEFWGLSEEMSEPGGSFQSDNMLSNEKVFARILPGLIAQTKPGGVYLGVGPEQNFTYIAAMKPRMVFITDIRRGNLHLHLMYKALFELSADRAEFVSRLFTKKRPAGLSATSSVTELMNAYWDAFSSDEAAYEANLKAILDQLTKTHSLPISNADFEGIARVYRSFYWYGPAINYSSRTTLNSSASGPDSYWVLMVQLDSAGNGLSYLGSEEKFAFLKDLQRRNMIIPVVGNFAGPKALRAVGAYVKERGATVSAFYLSNVEQYLKQGGVWPAFCANVATMPLDDASVFIRPGAIGGGRLTFTTPAGTVSSGGRGTYQVIGVPQTGPSLSSGLVPMAAEVKSCG